MTPSAAFLYGAFQGFALGIGVSIGVRLFFQYLKYKNRVRKIGIPKKRKAGR